MGSAQFCFAQDVKIRGPLKIVVGFAPGGSGDTQARAIAQRVSSEMGVPVIVENRTGANGQLAAEYVKSASADGTVALWANMHVMVMLPLTSRVPRYDSLKDFQAVGRAVNFLEAVVVPGDSPVKTFEQWLDLTRSNPSKRSFGVPALGSVPNFIGYQISRQANLEMVAIPYRGAAPLVQDLIGGQVPAGISPIGDVLPYVSSGKLKVLAINGDRRSALMPDVPTLGELGYPMFDSPEWTAFFLPKGASPEVVARWNLAIVHALSDPHVRNVITRFNNEPSPSTPEELRALIANDLNRWRPLVKASGFVAE